MVSVLLVLGSFIVFIISLIVLTIWLIKKRPFKKILVFISLFFVVFFIAIDASSDNRENANHDIEAISLTEQTDTPENGTISFSEVEQEYVHAAIGDAVTENEVTETVEVSIAEEHKSITTGLTPEQFKQKFNIRSTEIGASIFATKIEKINEVVYDMFTNSKNVEFSFHTTNSDNGKAVTIIVKGLGDVPYNREWIL